MKCPKCGKEVAEGVKFCSKCGASMMEKQQVESQEQVQFVVPQNEGGNGSQEFQGNQANQNYQGNQSFQVNQTYQMNQNSQTNPNMQYNQAIQQNGNFNVPPNNMNAIAGNQTSKKSMKIPPKFAFIGGGALVVLLLAILVLSKIFGGNSAYTTFSDKYMEGYRVIPDGEDPVMYFFTYGGKLIKTKESYTSLEYNLTRTVSAYINDDDELYCVNGSGSIDKVANDVSRFQISDDGTGIGYTTYEDEIDLYLYNVGTKKSSKIAKDIKNSSIIISPDGDSVCYMKEDEDYGDFKAYVSINGKEPKLIGKNYRPIAISNDGDYQYYVDDNKLYVKSKKDKQKLSDGVDGYILFNKSYSQVLFHDGGRSYISTKGSEKKKISNSRIRDIIVPDNVVSRYVDVGIGMGILGIDSFVNQLYVFDGDICYLDSKYDVREVSTGSTRDIQLSEDGETLLYSQYGTLYKVTKFDDKIPVIKPVGKEDDIYYFNATSDLSYIYYVNNDDELMCMSDKGKAKKIADDVESDDYYIDTKDDTVYFLSDGTLYYSQNGGAKKKIKGAEEVELSIIAGRVYYNVENDEDSYDVYLLSDGKAKCVLKEIEY